MKIPVDVQIISQIYQSHYGLIIMAASRYVPTQDQVYDVIHQVFIDFMNAAVEGTWDQSRDAGPLLYEMAKNRALNLWREEKKRLPENRQKVAERLMQMQREQKEKNTTLKEKITLLELCLDELPPRSKKLIEQRYFQQVTFEKIAQENMISPHSVRKALSRIRVKLRDCISKKQNEY